MADYQIHENGDLFGLQEQDGGVFRMQSAHDHFAAAEEDPDSFHFREADGDTFRSWAGLRGPHFTPHVDEAGILSWTNNGGLQNPAPVNIRGTPGTGLTIRGIVAAAGDLPASAETGDVWLVGSAAPYDGYMWTGSRWVNIGPILRGPAGEDGDPGYSPTVTITAITGGHRVTVTDAAGDHSFDILNGQDGEPGSAGYSPTVTVSTITGGHRVTITDADGDHPFDIQNGQDGDDYVLTTADKQEIASMAAQSVQTAILNAVYPVGSIYVAVNSTDPGTLFGGTWEQIEDRFLLAAGSSYAAGTQGGSANAIVPYHNHTTETGGAFTFTVRAIGRANGAYQVIGNSGVTDAVSGASQRYVTSNDGTTTGTEVQDRIVHSGHKHTVNYAGTSGNTAGANMPPYLAVYVWERTA